MYIYTIFNNLYQNAQGYEIYQVENHVSYSMLLEGIVTLRRGGPAWKEERSVKDTGC